MRSAVRVLLAILVATLAGACGSEGDDPTVRRAAERCVEQAQALAASARSAAEAECGKLQSTCDDDARRKELPCQQFLLRYR